jgi:Flp pilus assembly protein TadG
VCRRPDLEARRRERGSTLLLFPAALLIMVALAAMTVDSAIAFLAQRELVNATAAAANDAATEALSDRSFYEGNRVELSASGVEAVAVARIRALVDEARHHDLTVRAEAVPPAAAGCAWTVRVSASSRVDELFGKAMPGSSGQVAVHAQSVASPRSASGSC